MGGRALGVVRQSLRAHSLPMWPARGKIRPRRGRTVRHNSSSVSPKDALELMRCEQVHRLPVVNSDGVLQGILSSNDVMLHPDRRRGTTLVPPEEAPPAFDEKGRSPVERVFNGQEEDEIARCSPRAAERLIAAGNAWR